MHNTSACSSTVIVAFSCLSGGYPYFFRMRLTITRTETILRNHIALTDEQWQRLNYENLTFNANDSVAIGFAQEVAEFTPPAGSKLFTV